jgi:hypothetical protein
MRELGTAFGHACVADIDGRVEVVNAGIDDRNRIAGARGGHGPESDQQKRQRAAIHAVTG